METQRPTLEDEIVQSIQGFRSELAESLARIIPEERRLQDALLNDMNRPIDERAWAREFVLAKARGYWDADPWLRLAFINNFERFHSYYNKLWWVPNHDGSWSFNVPSTVPGTSTAQ